MSSNHENNLGIRMSDRAIHLQFNKSLMTYKILSSAKCIQSHLSLNVYH